MQQARKAPKINTVSFGFFCGQGQQTPMAAAEQHNEIEVNFVERGEMVFRRGVQTVKLARGATAIYWAAVPHQVVAVKPQTRSSWLALPLAWFLSWKLPAEFNKQMLGGEMLVLEKADFGFKAPRVSDWAGDFDRSQEFHIAVKLEIEAFFRRLAASPVRFPLTKKHAAPVLGAHQCRHAERMVATITERFREPLSIQEIARSAGLNPEYAMRLFRDRWGVTLWTFLLQQRIAEAKRLLLLSDASLVEVAFACGFQSIGRFYHAFKTQCQCSPGVYRRNHPWRSEHAAV